MVKNTVVVGILIAALLLVGCAPSLSDAKQQFCDDLAAVGQAIQKARGINADSTLEEVKETRQGLEEAMANARESLGVLKEVQFAETENAFGELIDTIKDIPDEAKLKEATASIQQAVDRFEAAYTKINTTVCVGQ
jgi:soluble cytochrome b562